MEKKYFVTVDDEKSIRKVLSLVAKRFCPDCDVEEAEDGEKGYALLEKLSFEENSKIFLVTDHGMPNLTGLDMIKKMKEGGLMDKMGDNLNIYMGFSPSKDYDEGIGREAIEIGAKDYLLKPFSLAILGEKIKSYFD